MSKDILFILCIAYLLFYIVSLFVGNKRIMAEGLMVAQVTFAAVIVCPQLNPLHSSITTLKQANNPYNIFYS